MLPDSLTVEIRQRFSWIFVALKTFALIFDAACFFVALVQVIQFIGIYFEYRTISKVTQTLDTFQSTPAVVLCSRYLDIIDVKGLKRDLGVDVKRTNKFHEIAFEMTKLTVKQILDYTPSTNESMEGCVIRDEYDFKMIYPRVEVCRESFDIFKFYMQEFVCYQYQFKQNMINSRFAFRRIANSLNYNNIIYKIQFGTSFDPSSIISIIVFSVAEDDYPFPAESRNWAPVSDRLEDFEKIVIKNNKFTASYELNKFDKLPPPYDTACDKGNTHNQCYSSCIRKRLVEGIKRVPFSEITSDRINLGHVNEQDLLDNQTRAFINESEYICQDLCKNTDCNFDFSVTHIREIKDVYRRGSIYSPNIIIQVKLPDFPTTSVTHEPRVSLTEFIIYLFNCIGIYFGISVLSLNPFRFWVNTIKRKTRNTRFSSQGNRFLPLGRRTKIVSSRTSIQTRTNT